MTPTQVLGEVVTNEMFKKSQKKSQGISKESDKKNIAFKANSSSQANKFEKDDEDSDSDKEMTLFVKKFNKFMKKRNNSTKDQISRKNPFEDRKCFECGEIGHISVNCPSNKKNKKDKSKDDKRKKKKKFFKRSKNGQAYFVEWDSDASSDSDSDSDSDDDSTSKGLAGIAIKEAPSLFSKPFCLMAKSEANVSSSNLLDDSDDDDDDELSYDDLVQMLNESNELLHKKNEKIEEMKRKYSSLHESHEELKTSHANLKDSHGKVVTSNGILKEKHEKLKEAHDSLLVQKSIEPKTSSCTTCDKCENLSNVSNSTNPSCSTSDASCTSDRFSCDATLMMENESLKKEVDCLSKDLSRWFGSHVKFNHCWTNQKFTLNKNGIDYLPKKGRKAFTPVATKFVKASVRYEEEDKVKTCHICKTKVALNHKCKSKKNISFDPSYVLEKNPKGEVHARFVGHTFSETKRQSIWVPKVLVANVQGPKKVWVPKWK
ncbi:unnamed protein product [Urochloa humidicola]